MPDVKMPLTAHLEELRWRLIKALVAVAVAFFAAFNFADWCFEVLTRPLLALNAESSSDDGHAVRAMLLRRAVGNNGSSGRNGRTANSSSNPCRQKQNNRQPAAFARRHF